jgi:DNA-binding IclR family transcriptional regulator
MSSIGRVLLANLQPRQLERYFQRAAIDRYTAMTITEPKKLRAEIDVGFARSRTSETEIEDRILPRMQAAAASISGQISG